MSRPCSLDLAACSIKDRRVFGEIRILQSRIPVPLETYGEQEHHGEQGSLLKNGLTVFKSKPIDYYNYLFFLFKYLCILQEAQVQVNFQEIFRTCAELLS